MAEIIAMEPIYDIFLTLPDGSPLWLESVEGLDEAKRRLSSFLHKRPGRYFIYSEKSGGVVERVTEDPEDAESAPAPKTRPN